MNRSGGERYSIPSFIQLDYDAQVRCIENCVSPERPARYSPVNCGDYLVGRFRDVHKFRQASVAQPTD